MKLYAQHGYGNGQKIRDGLSSNYIDGVIFSPKDIGLARLRETAAQLRDDVLPDADILFDPQFYATIPAVDPAASLGHLQDESGAGRDYTYFRPCRRSHLLSESRLVEVLDATLRFQATLDTLTAIISPNIVVPRSFDSAEAAISMDFIRNTRLRYAELGDARPVYATLAVAREALLDKEELLRFLNDLTALDARPDGFYLLVGVNSTEARSEIYHADVIAGWMYINHVLNLNGYRTINGYSDLLTPFLGAVGADAGTTGWWSNLRTFSMDRFAPPMGGGRMPVERYLSCGLLNRIAFYELDQVRDVVPGVLNHLATDALYPEGSSQPPRNQEVIQSWQAIHELNARLTGGTILNALGRCVESLGEATRLYGHVRSALPQSLDPKSSDQHLEPLAEGIRLFAALAEIELA